MTGDALQSVMASLGLAVALCAVGRFAILFCIDAYYDALERVRGREAALPAEERRHAAS